MDKKQVLEAINKSPVFYLATIENDKPRVRGMLLYKATEDGLIFHTAKIKELYNQLMTNNKVEVCFNHDGTQIRISGEVELVNDNNLKDEILQHPTRAFLKPWVNSMPKEEVYEQFIVFKLKGEVATLWTMEKNFEPKEIVQL